VLDTTARTPAGARIVVGATPARAIIAVGERAPTSRVAALEAAGATVLRCPTRDGRVSVDAVLWALFEREVRAVLLEGGGEVHAGFLEAGLVDRVTLFVAPLLLGGREAPGVVGGIGRELKSAVRLGPMTARLVGRDLLIEADVTRDETSPDRSGGARRGAAPARSTPDRGGGKRRGAAPARSTPDRRGGGALRSRPGGK
jgi:diaminohydroxyphosphoribosylaminopyrimidine deaminase/5-amino-6-(5-phosphoribosylamino)uracil reductase